MKKKMKLVGIMALVSILIFGIAPAQASLGVGLSGGYFSPNYGEVNDEFIGINEVLGTDLGFESGFAWGLNLNYDFNPNWRMRGEYVDFSSKTSEPFLIDGFIGFADFKLNLSALTLSGIYRFFPEKTFSPYIGVGVGSFSTEYEGEITVGPISFRASDNASPIGFRLLVGAEHKTGENVSILGELRYISAKAEDLLEGEGIKGIDVDWSGPSFGLGIAYRF
ncbi:MAG: porin family protein [Candidatus Aerophobetes bacterium]|nr:porin family protein [Candidatus Aerophobetes bacterium]